MTSEPESPRAPDPPAEATPPLPESAAPPPPPTAFAPAPTARERRLTRSRSDRWIAGVAGGLAEYLGVDPVLVRVGFVVLTVISSGLGFVFYLAAWLVVPEDDATSSIAESRTHHRGGGTAFGVVLGLLLMTVGLVWLLNDLNVDVPPWDSILSVALIAVGAALILSAGRSGAGGLIVLGVIITVVLAGISTINFRVDNAFGEMVERPSTLAELDREYSHAFGSLLVDLTQVELPEGTTRVRVSSSFGDVTVRTPSRVGVRVTANTVFGESRVLGEIMSGVSNNQSVETPDYDRSTRKLDIELNTAFGSATVTR